MHKTYIAAVCGVIAAGLAGYFLYGQFGPAARSTAALDAAPKNVTLAGTYRCLPHKDANAPATEECTFGMQTDEGRYYAVNFGASAAAMEQFQSGAHIKAEGFVVLREALSSDHWAKYDMEGIFTITKMLEASAPTTSGKINITAVCEAALAYMTFPNGASADAFVADCKEGKHPEVIERYTQEMNLGEGAAL